MFYKQLKVWVFLLLKVKTAEYVLRNFRKTISFYC